MSKSYNLAQVQTIYSAAGRSLLGYRLSASFYGFRGYLSRQAVKALQLKPGNVVLDLACGPGLLLPELERAVGSRGKILMVDYVPEMINHVQKKIKTEHWQNVQCYQQDAAKLNLPVNSLDGMISMIGLSAIPDYKTAIRVAYRALKPSGRLVVIDGKKSNFKWINICLKALRWSKSYQKIDLIKELENVFGQLETKEYFLGTTFLAVATKR